MNLSAIWSVIKIVVLVVLVATGMWLYKEFQFRGIERDRALENAHQQRIQDSTQIVHLKLRGPEINEYLKYQDPALLRKLEDANIRVSRVESIQSTTLKYLDNLSRSYDVTRIADAIKNNIPSSAPFIDSTGCMIIGGQLRYANDSLKINITRREFKNKSDAVAYWQRREWRFLGIKTRFLGKKEFTAKMFDECGQSKALRIEKQK